MATMEKVAQSSTNWWRRKMSIELLHGDVLQAEQATLWEV